MKHFVIAAAIVLGASPAMAQMQDNNPFGDYRNSPRVYAPDGRYLGTINSNTFDPDSVANPFSRLGGPLSPDNPDNNPFGYPSSPRGYRAPRY